MKRAGTVPKGFLILFVGIFLLGCKKESTPVIPLNQKIDTSFSKPSSSIGGFMNGPYGMVTGKARIYLTNGTFQLALSNFSTSNGPDLKVYISQEQNPVHFINLGPLKSTTGDQIYDIPTVNNVSSYTYALIFCQQYQHLFGFTQISY